MIFLPKFIPLIEEGIKTQTRRLKPSPYLAGRVYAIQPGRGQKGVGFIRILRVWPQYLCDQTFGGMIIPGMTEDDAKAEGCESKAEFLRDFADIYGIRDILPPYLYVSVYEFEYVGRGKL